MIQTVTLTLMLLFTTPSLAAEFDWQYETTAGGSSLSAYQGKPIILHLWASWCPPCRQEMPQIDVWKKQHPQVQLIVVSLDSSTSDALLFLRQNHIDLPAWTGKTAQAMRLGVRGLPATLLIDSNGNIQQRMVGARDWSNSDFSKRMLAWLQPAASHQPRP